jgi:hypothetical protein
MVPFIIAIIVAVIIWRQVAKPFLVRWAYRRAGWPSVWDSIPEVHEPPREAMTAAWRVREILRKERSTRHA